MSELRRILKTTAKTPSIRGMTLSETRRSCQYAATKLHKNIGLCAVYSRFLLVKSQKYCTFAHIVALCANRLFLLFAIFEQEYPISNLAPQS